MRYPYIGFEGPIGAGKTTLAGLLAVHTAGRLVLEDVDGNEFLADFYSDRRRWALPMQLWFLTARHRQLNDLVGFVSSAIIADYTFAKDRIFARTLLSDSELRLYDRIATGLKEIRHPDLVVYLDAKDDVLLERIAKRNRRYESAITTAYLDEVRQAYEHYMRQGIERNVLKFDTSTLNLNSAAELDDLFHNVLARCN